MNTSELTARQAELDRQLKDQDYLHRLSMEQSNLLRREKETLDAYLQVQAAVVAAAIPTEAPAAVEGIAVPPPEPVQEQPLAQQKVQQQQKQQAPVKKAVQKKAPVVISKKKK